MKKILITLVLPVLLSACVMTENEDTTFVYINDGSMQCEEGGKSGLETAKILEDSNVNVESTQCGGLTNIAVLAMCGGPATNINVHEIKSEDLAKAESLGFKDVATLKQENNKGYEVSDCK